MKKVTIKEIAALCGTTPKTVSKALNNKGSVSDKIVDKILKTAEEIGYIPNATAKGLRQGQSRIIGIIIDNLLNPYYMIIIHLLDKCLQNYGYDYMIFDSKSMHLNRETAIKVVSRGIDGIISFLEPTPETVTLLSKQRVPLVVAGRKYTDTKVDCVYTDDFNGGYVAMKKFLADGIADVLVLGGPPEIECSVRRAEGVKSALTDAGHRVREEYFRTLEPKFDNSVEALMQKVFDDNLRFSAIFCFNDIWAQSLIQVLNRHKIAIPDACEIIAYDDISTHYILPNRVTSVSYDKVRLASELVGIIVSKIDRGSYSYEKEIMLPTYLSPGETTL